MPPTSSQRTDVSVAVLAGGVGAARFLTGLVQVVTPAAVTAIVNTGDDQRFHGLHVSPDLDTITYTLAGAHNENMGWGLADDTFRCMDALERFEVETWFRLGDADLATHLYRTTRLAAGATLSEVTREIAAAWGLGLRLMPMSDDPAPTFIDTSDHGRLAMQEWFVHHRSQPAVKAVDLAHAASANPAPGVLDAIDSADVIVIAPSNPFISIAPILTVPGIRQRLATRRERVVAVSPIVGGTAVKGPADRMMHDLGIESSPAGVAAQYADCCRALVLDIVDQAEASAVETAGCVPIVTDTVMREPAVAAALASECIRSVIR